MPIRGEALILADIYEGSLFEGRTYSRIYGIYPVILLTVSLGTCSSK